MTVDDSINEIIRVGHENFDDNIDEILDELNFRSDVRRLAGDYLDDDLEDNRQVHDFIAHYANEINNREVISDLTVTTMQHSECVIITDERQRNPLYTRSFLLDLRRDLPATESRRFFKNEFRDLIESYIRTVAHKALDASAYDHRQPFLEEPN